MNQKQKLMTITPALARDFLKKNVNNRPVRQIHVDFLASEIAGGRWVVTHQGIAFSGDHEVLLDGQHRLLAIIQAGIAVDMWVAWGLPAEAQSNMDAGIATRGVGDQLHLVDGISNANLKAAAVRSLVSICCYYQTPKCSVGFTRSVLLDIDRDMDFVLTALDKFKPARRAWVIGALTLAYSAERAVGPFIEAFGSGENLKNGDPAKAARDWLLNSNISVTYKRNAIESILNAAYNAVNGSSITQLKKGERGAEYFRAKKRKLVTTLREQMLQQLETSPAANRIAA